MKKILYTISVIVALLIPSVSFATTVTWQATSSDPGFANPTPINGNYDAIQVPYIKATSTTASQLPYASSTATTVNCYYLGHENSPLACLKGVINVGFYGNVAGSPFYGADGETHYFSGSSAVGVEESDSNHFYSPTGEVLTDNQGGGSDQTQLYVWGSLLDKNQDYGTSGQCLTATGDPDEQVLWGSCGSGSSQWTNSGATTTLTTGTVASAPIIVSTTASTTNETVSSLGSSAGTFVAADKTGKLIATTTPAGGVSSVSNSDGSLTISPTTGSVVASLNAGHTNMWSVFQGFNGGLSATGATINGTFNVNGSSNLDFGSITTDGTGDLTTASLMTGAINADSVTANNIQANSAFKWPNGNPLADDSGTLYYADGTALTSSGVLIIESGLFTNGTQGNLGDVLTSGGDSSPPSWVGTSTLFTAANVASMSSATSTGSYRNQTATVSAVNKYTPTASSTYQISVDASVRTISAGTLTLTCTYTNTDGVSTTATFFPMGLTTAGLSGTGSPSLSPLIITPMKNNAITVVATFTGVSINYDVDASIQPLGTITK